MNRRSFLASILRAGASAAILPAAVTYGRKWKRHWKPRPSGIFVRHEDGNPILNPGSISNFPIACPTPAQLERIFRDVASVSSERMVARDFETFCNAPP